MNITIQITKTKLALLIGVIALAGTSVAWAAHPFTDVEDSKWYSDAVDWAYNKDITTGKTPTIFNGDDGVSDNADDHDTQVGRVAHERYTDEDHWDGSNLKTDVTIEIPMDGFLIVNYTANLAKDFNETGSGDVFITAELEHEGDSVGEFYAAIDLDKSLLESDPHTLSFTHVLEAEAGDNDVDVTLSHNGAATDLVYVHSENLNVLFVPFDANNEIIIIPLGADDGRNHNPTGNQPAK